MSINATLAEVKTWSLKDRLELVQAVWDTIENDSQSPGLSDDCRKELDRRAAEMGKHPEQCMTYEEFKAKIGR